MNLSAEIHPDFQYYLDFKDGPLIDLYKDLRAFIVELFPEANELLYHTHALTSVYSVSQKLGDAFCMIPIYTAHLNLGFSKGTVLEDPHKLLHGTGKLIRHIPIQSPEDYRRDSVKELLQAAHKLAVSEQNRPTKSKGKQVSKIKR